MVRSSWAGKEPCARLWAPHDLSPGAVAQGVLNPRDTDFLLSPVGLGGAPCLTQIPATGLPPGGGVRAENVGDTTP